MSESKSPEAREVPQSPRILYIEDDENLGRLLPRFVPGFSFDIATKMPEAEEMLSGNYDAIVTDFDFPGGNGFDIARRIQEEGKKTPVVIISGREFDPDELKKNGVLFSFQKPFEVNKVIDAFERLRKQISVKRK